MKKLSTPMRAIPKTRQSRADEADDDRADEGDGEADGIDQVTSDMAQGRS